MPPIQFHGKVHKYTVHNNMIESGLKIAVIPGDDKTLVSDNWLGLLEILQSLKLKFYYIYSKSNWFLILKIFLHFYNIGGLLINGACKTK